jgi:putative flippase GtrA
LRSRRRFRLVRGCGHPVWHQLFPAGAASFLAATAVNYILSITYVFESGVRFSKKTEWLVVLAVSGWGLILNQCSLWALIEAGGVHVLVAKVIATGCVFLWNYGVRRYFVFARRG